MVRFVGLVLLLSGLFIAYVGAIVPMNDLGDIGSIDGETWLRTSMTASGLGSAVLGLFVLLARKRTRA